MNEECWEGGRTDLQCIYMIKITSALPSGSCGLSNQSRERKYYTSEFRVLDFLSITGLNGRMHRQVGESRLEGKTRQVCCAKQRYGNRLKHKIQPGSIHLALLVPACIPLIYATFSFSCEFSMPGICYTKFPMQHFPSPLIYGKTPVFLPPVYYFQHLLSLL